MIRRFIYQNYGSFYPKTFTIVNVSNSLSNTSDLNRYYFNYLVDNNSYDVGTTLNLTSRKESIEYFRQRNNTNSTVPLKAGYRDLSYSEFSNIPTFRVIDQAARMQYPNQLGNAIVSQVSEGRLPDKNLTYQVIYMSNGTYYEINSP